MLISRKTLFLTCVLTAVGCSSDLFAQKDFRPNMGPDLPLITVESGDVTILLRQRSQWTPARIDFRGVALTTEHSAYGTVFCYPEIGFIGTGHLENEPEELQSLAFYLDGEKIETPEASLSGKHFRFERESRIRKIVYSNTVELKDNKLYESAVVRAEEDTPQKLFYHFMHAWIPTVSEFLAGYDNAPDQQIGGKFPTKEELEKTGTASTHQVNQAVDWVAVYEPESQRFAVSRILEAPESAGAVSFFWNVPGRYNKYYLKNFSNDTIPAGFEGQWRMVTAFGESPQEGWQEAARALAASLKE